MRNLHLAGALVLGVGLLAGCSADKNASESAASAAASRADRGVGNAAPLVMQRSPTASFASLPDRGELVAYDKVHPTKHRGAYTAYPVALSEAHALNASFVGGELTLTAPNGEPIHLNYERHVEHADGNWSWIGRDANGAEALLTFGEKAVFGSVPQGGKDTLRLTMSSGRAYLVATDRSKLAGLDGASRAVRRDQFVAPKLAAQGMAASAASPSLANATASAASTTTIDILLGYTNGLSAQLGSDSAAVTRLSYLADVTNQAYVASGVTMRVRLVKTLKVTYADNTDNGDALEKLTGYTEDGDEITPDPAFTALRKARNDVGADLVSLVRAFRTPENSGCGIAWLIGGGESGITTADAPFGYSVVSDGNDLDEGDSNTYFCRDETLAHEMGHNMGQAHNEEDSTSTGVHPYSYGYREAGVAGFYTIMAYPVVSGDDSQTGIRYFANPTIKFAGRPTGVANQTDNVRSMNLVMPTIGKFRATVVPINTGPGTDVNGDGRSDLLWSRQSSGQFVRWLMNGSKIITGKSFTVSTAWRAIGTGDLDGNGYADVVWKNDSTGQIYVWLGDGSTFISKSVGNRSGWSLIGTGDVDSDGRSDLLWSRPGTGEFVHWIMNGATVSSGKSFTVSSAWRGIGVGDLNDDGYADVIWKNDSNGGQVYVWRGTGSGYSPSASIGSRAGWTLVGAADVNKDGKDDLIWNKSGLLVHWLMNGATITTGKSFTVNSAWRAIGAADFNGNGYADIVWKNDSNGGQIYIWSGNGSAYTASASIGSRAGWSLVPMQ